jgi:hypothetical protein
MRQSDADVGLGDYSSDVSEEALSKALATLSNTEIQS